jgi:hypothetical protein
MPLKGQSYSIPAELKGDKYGGMLRCIMDATVWEWMGMRQKVRREHVQRADGFSGDFGQRPSVTSQSSLVESSRHHVLDGFDDGFRVVGLSNKSSFDRQGKRVDVLMA